MHRQPARLVDQIQMRAVYAGRRRRDLDRNFNRPRSTAKSTSCGRRRECPIVTLPLQRIRQRRGRAALTQQGDLARVLLARQPEGYAQDRLASKFSHAAGLFAVSRIRSRSPLRRRRSRRSVSDRQGEQVAGAHAHGHDRRGEPFAATNYRVEQREQSLSGAHRCPTEITFWKCRRTFLCAWCRRRADAGDAPQAARASPTSKVTSISRPCCSCYPPPGDMQVTVSAVFRRRCARQRHARASIRNWRSRRAATARWMTSAPIAVRHVIRDVGEPNGDAWTAATLRCASSPDASFAMCSSSAQGGAKSSPGQCSRRAAPQGRASRRRPSSGGDRDIGDGEPDVAQTESVSFQRCSAALRPDLVGVMNRSRNSEDRCRAAPLAVAGDSVAINRCVQVMRWM